MNATTRILIILGGAVLLAACASRPESLEEINQARSLIETASQDPQAASNGAVALEQARDALEEAEQGLRSGKDLDVVRHHAYLARQEAQLALTLGESAEARKAVQQAEARRQDVQLRAREAEINQARAESQRLRQELDQLAARRLDGGGAVLTLGEVVFSTDEAELQPGARSTMDRIASFLRRNENQQVRIEGHTDSRGSDDYNQALSQDRAEAVADALRARGIDRNRIEAVGLGEAYPVATNETTAGRQRNRRVDIVFSDSEGDMPPPGAAASARPPG